MLPISFGVMCHPERSEGSATPTLATRSGSFGRSSSYENGVAARWSEFGWSSGLGLLEMNGVTERLEAANGASDDGLAVAFIEVGLTQVFIGAAASEQVVAGHQDAVAHGHDRSLVATASSQTAEQGWQITATLGLTGAPRSLGQRRAQPWAAFASAGM